MESEQVQELEVLKFVDQDVVQQKYTAEIILEEEEYGLEEDLIQV